MGIHSNSALLSLLARRLLRTLYLNSPRQVLDTYTLVKWFSCSYSNTRSASPVKLPLVSERKFSAWLTGNPAVKSCDRQPSFRLCFMRVALGYYHQEYCETERSCVRSTSRSMSARGLCWDHFITFSDSQRCGWSFGHRRAPVVVSNTRPFMRRTQRKPVAFTSKISGLFYGAVTAGACGWITWRF